MKRLHRRCATLPILCLVTLGLATVTHAYDAARVSDPQSLGFSPSRLARIAAWQQTQVDSGAFSGAVAAIARNGKVAYLRAVGFRDQAKTSPLQGDAIFWIASMTKPVTSVAAIMLVEEGKLDLAAPVHQYLPELKDMMVGVERKDAASGKIDLVYESQKHPMTVEDLLRHTAGLVYGVGGTMVDQLVGRRLYGNSGVWRRDRTLADVISELAKLPLAHQPGDVWDYGLSVDVLARVIEVASGQPFDQFLDTRLFKPLGMVDTAFAVPAAKLSRLVDPPANGWGGPPDSVLADITRPTSLFSGGGGLASTAGDYLRFCQMLLNGGELDGVRILSPASVRRMTTNALPGEIRFAGFASGLVGPQSGSTWGLGFAVRSDAAWSVVPGSTGSFSWMGVSGTYFWVDPTEQLVAAQMIHVRGGSGPFQRMFRDLTYGAFRIPDQVNPDAAAGVMRVDANTLAGYAGTYRFASSNARDRQEASAFGGVGLEITTQGGAVKVVSPIKDAPAAKAGVIANDMITHLDGEAMQGRPLNQVLDKMRGPANTAIRLRIMRKGQIEPIELTVVRASIRAPGVDLQLAAKDGKLQVEATGALPVLDFEKGAPIAVVPMSSDAFFVDGGDHTRLAFSHDEAGKATGLVLNPGPWQITGQRID
ncbi:CubicO group peptidase (beta-lactamase class C family) [Bradyrhizobium sp. cir1]|uniref:serine hydrolase n=1 Tax=Bradyrhizobium sp. cir1 TaxID=1445730 RepID=UPI0016059D9D|nr:serine hydrolase [Bradyrhizobium sp. cir1]MBB4367705.1 CubicO group peptidase (beta-lactamase class C family) [Bradyrhizobium sp. cir1]